LAQALFGSCLTEQLGSRWLLARDFQISSFKFPK